MPSPAQMTALIDTHLEREAAGDAAGAVAVYTDDVVHDVVGSPMGVLSGPESAQLFYEHLINDLKIDKMDKVREGFGEDFTVVEHVVDAAVPGTFLGIEGRGRSVHFRMLHVFDFRDGKISRENVWLDGGSIAHQLSS